MTNVRIRRPPQTCMCSAAMSPCAGSATGLCASPAAAFGAIQAGDIQLDCNYNPEKT